MRMKELQGQNARIQVVAQMVGCRPHVPLSLHSGMRRMYLHQCRRPHKGTTPTPAVRKVNEFDATAETFCVAFDAFSEGLLFRDPSDDVDIPEEHVFIASWVDYCHKYGIPVGYALADGSVGVHFNDRTTPVFAADKQYFDYRRQGTVYVCKNYTVEDYLWTSGS
ncbi:hypothetical protein EDB89DRAFT_637338 [Lactarius sanguifluus]|nr:hypothetical protein EDB89DRAFT_637338 [Lactarius sanguifluus]